MKVASQVLGYAPMWSADVAPKKILWDRFTHLCASFALPEPDGAVAPPENLIELARAAKQNGVGVLVSVGGAGSNPKLSAAMSKPDGARKLTGNLLRLLETPGVVGLDIDWEAHETADDSARTTALCLALREKMGRMGSGKLLTMAVSATDWGGRWIDTTALLPAIDQLHLMSYDFHGPWSQTAGPNANLFPTLGDDSMSVSLATDYWTQKKRWPASRLLLGLPGYGRGFRASAWGGKTSGKSAFEYVAYNEIVALQASGWKTIPDPKSSSTTLLSPDGRDRISFDSPADARAKGAFARKQNLGGIFVWEITQDRTKTGHALIDPARDAFLAKR